MATPLAMTNKSVAIVGAGPAGLMAAEVLASAGCAVTLYDAMAAPARKFLLAGKSGLNITHSEPHADLLARYGQARRFLEPALNAFTSNDIRSWAAGLGVETFVGSSGRVFPVAMKASPLLRAWLRRLDGFGVRLMTRHRWVDFEMDALRFAYSDGHRLVRADATIFALGGASYPRLGSDAGWVGAFKERGISISPLRPANCGFDVAWSEVFASRFAGQPVKPVALADGQRNETGEFVVTANGVEGSFIYAHSAGVRDALERGGQGAFVLDLAPGRSTDQLESDLRRQPAKASLTNRLRKGARLDGVKAGLLREFEPALAAMSPEEIARRIKHFELPVLRTRPIAEAISSAGGISRDDLDDGYMLSKLPGQFAAGEMIDWEAPTGGYLLTGCLATGRAAAQGVLRWLDSGRD